MFKNMQDEVGNPDIYEGFYKLVANMSEQTRNASLHYIKVLVKLPQYGVYISKTLRDLNPDLKYDDFTKELFENSRNHYYEAKSALVEMEKLYTTMLESKYCTSLNYGSKLKYDIESLEREIKNYETILVPYEA